MNREELYEVRGGIQAISAAMISAIVRAVETIYDIGRAFGSAIKRAKGRSC